MNKTSSAPIRDLLWKATTPGQPPLTPAELAELNELADQEAPSSSAEAPDLEEAPWVVRWALAAAE